MAHIRGHSCLCSFGELLIRLSKCLLTLRAVRMSLAGRCMRMCSSSSCVLRTAERVAIGCNLEAMLCVLRKEVDEAF